MYQIVLSFFHFSSSSFIYFSIYPEPTTIVIPFNGIFPFFMIATELLITLCFLCRLIVSQMKIKLYFLRVHPSVKLIKPGIVDNEGSSRYFSSSRIVPYCNNLYRFVAFSSERSRDIIHANDQRHLFTHHFYEAPNNFSRS